MKILNGVTIGTEVGATTRAVEASLESKGETMM
jgi:hypothetical protein